MHGLILAAGDGSRLARDGVSEPKALVRIGGVPQVVRLAATMRALGCATVTAVLREDLLPALEAARPCPNLGLETAAAPWPDFERVPARTPSSLHTLLRGFDVLAPGPVFCSMVDTVMRDADWRRLFAACRRSLDGGATAAIAVTPFTTGDGALHAAVDASGRVTRLAAEASPSGRVTGGVYAFAPEVRPLAAEAAASGADRMRGFLAWLLERGIRVDAVDVERIIDVDRASDLALAAALLGGALPGGVPSGVPRE